MTTPPVIFPPTAGELHNMSVPPRTRFEASVVSVAGRFFVFRLAPPPNPLTKRQTGSLIFDCGLPDIPTREEVEAAALALPAFLIGVGRTSILGTKVEEFVGTAGTIAILSRRIGEIYVRSRQPDYAAGHLFGQQPFAVEAWEDSL